MDKQASFSIPISGTITLEDGYLKITVNPSEIKVRLDFGGKGKRLSLERGRTLFDLVLESARKYLQNSPSNRFTGADLYHIAKNEYQDLKRNSFAAHVIASTPNHSSYKHYPGKRDYFSRIGPGMYRLNDQYLEGGSPNEGQTLFNRSAEINEV